MGNSGTTQHAPLRREPDAEPDALFLKVIENEMGKVGGMIDALSVDGDEASLESGTPGPVPTTYTTGAEASQVFSPLPSSSHVSGRDSAALTNVPMPATITPAPTAPRFTTAAPANVRDLAGDAEEPIGVQCGSSKYTIDEAVLDAL
jgi:hypothetical protein